MKIFFKLQLFFVLLFPLIYHDISAQTFTHNWALNLGNLGPGNADITGSCTDSQNHYYCVGILNGTVDAMPGSNFQFINSGTTNTSKAFFAEYDSSGALFRAFSFGGVGGKTTLSAIATDVNGDIIIAGNFKDSSYLEPNQPQNAYYTPGMSIAGDGFLARYDSNFNLIWLKTFINTQTFTISKIEIDNSGKINTAGIFNYAVDIDPSAGTHTLSSYPAAGATKDLFLAQFSSAGNLNWVRSIGTPVNDELADISFDAANNIYIGISYGGDNIFIDSVYVTSSVEDEFMGILKFDNNGQLSYNYHIATSGSSGYIKLYDIKANEAGEVFFTGSLWGSVYFRFPSILEGCGTGVLCEYFGKLNTQGNCSWAKTNYNSSSVGRSLDLDDVSNIFWTGYFSGTKDFDFSTNVVNLTSTPSTSSNYFLSSYDSIGNYRWAYRIPTFGFPDLRLSQSKKVWLEGDFSGSADFNPGASTNTLTVPSATNFVTTYTQNGSYQDAFALKGCGSTKDVATAVNTHLNQGVVVAGMFTGELDFDFSNGQNVLAATGDSSAYLAWYQTNGTLSWARLISGKAYVKSVAVNDSGYVFATGYFSGAVDFDTQSAAGNLTSNTGSNDIFMAKFYPNGGLIWVYKFGSANGDEGHDICIDQNGNVVMTGIFNTLVDFDPSPGGTFDLTTPQSTTNGYVAKYDENGNFIFAFKMPGTIANKVKTDPNHNVIVNGTLHGFGNFNTSGSNGIVYSTGGPNDDDYFIAKYDSAGNYLYAFKIGSVGNDKGGSDIRLDNAGNIYFAGYMGANGDTVDLDPSGSDYLVLGDDGIVAKYSPSGNFQWGFATGFSAPLGLGLDVNGNLSLACVYHGVDDVDPGPGTSILGGNYQSMALIRYSSVGQFLNGNSFTAAIKIIPTQIAITDSNRVYSVGQYAGNIDFDPAPGNQNLFLNNGTTANTNGFLLSLTQSDFLAQIPPMASFNSSTNSICEGVCINFQDNSLYAPNSWTWQFPGGNPSGSTAQNPQGICYSSAGQYDVRLIVSNPLGTDTLLMSNYISVFPVPQVNAGIDLALCEGGSIQLNGSGAQTYDWSPAVGLSSTSIANPIANPGSTTTYLLTGANGTCSASDEVTITVNPNPATPLISLISGELQSTPAFSYQWFLNGLPITGATFQNYFPAQPGNYSVTVYDSSGCYSASGSYTVTVVGVNNDWPENNNFLIAPNPFENEIFILSNQEKNDVLIKLMDVSGRIILMKELNFSSRKIPTNLSLPDLEKGIYYLEISDGTGNKTFKMLKAK